MSATVASTTSNQPGLSAGGQVTLIQMLIASVAVALTVALAVGLVLWIRRRRQVGVRPAVSPKERLRRTVRVFSSTAILAGFLMLSDAAITMAWQEPVTAIWGRVQQHKLEGKLKSDSFKLQPETQNRLDELDQSKRASELARIWKRQLSIGDAAGKISIPRLKANFVLVWGTDPGSLQKGPGFYNDQPLPGQHGTVAIAGHRTTYLAPFRHVDRLKPGDVVTAQMPYGRFVYTVRRTIRVRPDQTSVLKRIDRDQLLMSACDPPFSAARRIIVFADLTKSELK